jgi:hypothetical protein
LASADLYETEWPILFQSLKSALIFEVQMLGELRLSCC